MADPNDTIKFSSLVTGTIELKSVGSGQIDVDKSLTIEGPGANLLTIKAFDPDSSGNNDSDGNRVFYIDGSGTLNVTISGLTLTNGDPEVSGENNGGGAILNLENLTLSSCVLTNNFAPNGGAIYSPNGTLTVTDCTITGNAAGDGGGLLIEGGSATLSRTTISNNQVTNSGGGLLNRGRPVTIVDSTISGNSAEERGGGLYLYQGSLTVTGSTISGNVSDFDDDQSGSGGGIYNAGGGLSVTSSTISGNSSGEDGGGIFNNTSQPVTINHSTVFGNSVTNHGSNVGGGIRTLDPAVLNHTIVAGNLKGSTPNDVSGSVSATFSLISPANPSLVVGPLADNGGRTKTHALLPGSNLAIDAGDSAAIAGSTVPATDQRGVPFSRIADGDNAGGARIDIGAYEKQPAMNLVVDISADENDFNYAAEDLSLREAIALANGNVGVVDTISFGAALNGATILLTMGELVVRESVNINGLGANALTIDASGNDPTPLVDEGNGVRVLSIDDGVAGTFSTVQISGLRLTGGDVSGGGGAIFNRENLVLTAVEVTANHAATQGGGIRHELGSLTINDSTIRGNSAATGGAIWSDTDLATHTALLANSTISGNSATTRGGGLHNEDGRIVIRHSTVTSNSAPAGQGGGVSSFGDSLTRTEVHSTIIAGNTNSDVSFVGGVVNSFQSNNYNLVGSGNATGEFIESNDNNTVTDPQLGALANNGGPTPTHLPLTGSPAIDTGNLAAMVGIDGVPQFDQRGNPHNRILNGHIDIGAVETLAPPAPELPGDYNLNDVVDAADYVLWRRTEGTNVPQYSGADGDGNGMVGDNDYTVWRSNFDEVPMPGTGSQATMAAASLPQATATGFGANNVAQGSAGEKAAAAAFAALAPSAGVSIAPKGALQRAPQVPSSRSEIDLLLAMAPVYANDVPEPSGLTSFSDDALAVDDAAFDAALAEDCDAGAIALEW